MRLRAHQCVTRRSEYFAPEVRTRPLAPAVVGAGAAESSELAAAQQQLSGGMEVVRSAGLDKATVTAKFEQAK